MHRANITYVLFLISIICCEYLDPTDCSASEPIKIQFSNNKISPQYSAYNGPYTYYKDAHFTSFHPVPPNKLSNYRSLKRGQTNAEFQEAYNIALSIVTPLAELSRDQQLIEIAQALRARFDDGGKYSTSAKHYNTPYGYFVLRTASCAGCTRSTGLCLNILGIPYEHVNENKWAHQWCRVNIKGTYWICDAFGLYVGPEPAPHKHPNGYN